MNPNEKKEFELEDILSEERTRRDGPAEAGTAGGPTPAEEPAADLNAFATGNLPVPEGDEDPEQLRL